MVRKYSQGIRIQRLSVLVPHDYKIKINLTREMDPKYGHIDLPVQFLNAYKKRHSSIESLEHNKYPKNDTRNDIRCSNCNTVYVRNKLAPMGSAGHGVIAMLCRKCLLKWEDFFKENSIDIKMQSVHGTKKKTLYTKAMYDFLVT